MALQFSEAGMIEAIALFKAGYLTDSDGKWAYRGTDEALRTNFGVKLLAVECDKKRAAAGGSGIEQLLGRAGVDVTKLTTTLRKGLA